MWAKLSEPIDPFRAEVIQDSAADVAVRAAIHEADLGVELAADLAIASRYFPVAGDKVPGAGVAVLPVVEPLTKIRCLGREGRGGQAGPATEGQVLADPESAVESVRQVVVTRRIRIQS